MAGGQRNTEGKYITDLDSLLFQNAFSFLQQFVACKLIATVKAKQGAVFGDQIFKVENQDTCHSRQVEDGFGRGQIHACLVGFGQLGCKRKAMPTPSSSLPQSNNKPHFPSLPACLNTLS